MLLKSVPKSLRQRSKLRQRPRKRLKRQKKPKDKLN